ncbi:MAG TPA: glycosyltransferase [Candidatus Paceibacterota bacterium]
MKLLIITQKVDIADSNLGFFHSWIAEFAKYCEQVTVICLQEGAHNLPANVIVKSLGKERGTNKLTQILTFAFCTLNSSYDAVLVHMNPEYLVLAGWYWRLLGKRVALWYTHKHVDLKLKIAEKFANIIFTASAGSFRLKSKKVVVTGHGIDTDHFSPDPSVPREKFALTVGRISPAKHIQEIIDSTPAQYELVIAGAPITKQDYEYKEHLTGKATFLGPVLYKNLPDLYRRASLFVNMSTTGSIDKAVLEALACDTPVKTTNEAFLNMPETDRREWVIENHSLKRLIPKIVERLKNC